MICRTFDPSIFNEIANQPEVRPTISGHLADKTSPVDFSDLADRPGDYILLTDFREACSIIEVKTPVVMDAHSLFSPKCRGADAIRTCKEMVDWLFCHTRAEIITGATPVELRAARAFNRRVGFQSSGVRTLQGLHWTHAYEHFHILRSTWTARTPIGLNKA